MFVGAEFSSVKLLLQRVVATLSQTVTDTQSSSLLDVKPVAALSKPAAVLLAVQYCQCGI